MVSQELDNEKKELIDLAERVGYLDPNRATSQFDLPTTVESFTPRIPSFQKSSFGIVKNASQSDLSNKSKKF